MVLINPSNQTITQYNPLVGAANNLITNISPGASGTIFQSGGASANPAYTTATYPATTTTNQVLYSSAANTVTGLATANSAILATNSSGVPSITTASGNWLNTSRSCFAVYLSGDVANVTGDATNYKVAFNTASFDQASNFDTATNYVFTAPVAGRYLFTWSLVVYNLGAAHTQGGVYLTYSGGAFNNIGICNTALGRELTSGTNLYGFTGSLIIAMTASSTVSLNVRVEGSTKTVGVAGGSNRSYFTGMLVC